MGDVVTAGVEEGAAAISRLQESTVMAQALSAATGAAVSEESVASSVVSSDSERSDIALSGGGQDGDRLWLRLEGIVAVACCCALAMCLACTKCCRRQGVCIAEIEEPQHGKNTSAATKVRSDVDQPPTIAPGTWVDDRFDIIEYPPEVASQIARGKPSPMMPSRSAAR